MPKNPLDGFHWSARDWLSSRAKALMTVEQQGAYRNLLDHAWVADPPCLLPDDDAELAILSGLGSEKWAESGPVIRQWFVQRRGKLLNEKQFTTFRVSLKLRRERIAAGKKGGRKSAERRGERGKQSLSVASSNGAAPLNPSSSSFSSSPSEKRRTSPAPASPPDPRRELWDLGLSVLTSGRAGIAVDRARSLIGRWIGQVGEDKLGELIARAAAKPPADPIAWFEAAMRGGAKREPTVDEQREALRKQLAMIRRHDPDFRGGMPDPHATNVWIDRKAAPIWREILLEAGLDAAGVAA